MFLGTSQYPQGTVVTYTATSPKIETSLQGLVRATWFTCNQNLPGWNMTIFSHIVINGWTQGGAILSRRKGNIHFTYIFTESHGLPVGKEHLLSPFYYAASDQDISSFWFVWEFPRFHIFSKYLGPRQSVIAGHLRWTWDSTSTAKRMLISLALSCHSSMMSSDRPINGYKFKDVIPILLMGKWRLREVSDLLRV